MAESLVQSQRVDRISTGKRQANGQGRGAVTANGCECAAPNSNTCANATSVLLPPRFLMDELPAAWPRQ
jgi:hypothetical protein